MISTFANPQRFMRLSDWLLPLTAMLATLLLVVGLTWGFVFSPEDAVQRQSVRIMYVHVPAVFLGMGVFSFMAVCSLISFVWRHALADVAARCAAPIGACYTALGLATGSLWGAPTWGAWWVWDARLTSFLILFLTYVGYIALRAAVEDEAKAARLAAILCLAGAINLPIVHYSVEWWSTLHQPSSVFRAGGASIHPTMAWPLAVCAGGYAVAFVALLLGAMRTEIYRRRAEALSRAVS